MKLRMRVLPTLAAAAVLCSMMSAVPADAAKITLIRGDAVQVVDSNAGGRVLRPSVAEEPVRKPYRGGRAAYTVPVAAVGGDPLWVWTKRGLVACTLGSSGYAGRDRIFCTAY